ncbi:hypothetical protein EP7_002115 [Isosphaeraceae bacterium EP7]
MIDRLRESGQALGGQPESWREQALGASAAAREGFADGTERLKTFVINQPAKALGLALLVGVALGWLVKRR